MNERATTIPSAGQKEYVRYAEHCLAMAKLAPDQQSRVIQREMAAEWLKLADELESAFA